MKLTNKFNLPAPIVAALSENNYTKGESHRSVTTLIDSPRVRILREKYEDQIEEDVSEVLLPTTSLRSTLRVSMFLKNGFL